MPSIGGTELVIILVFAFLLFGPDKLPQMGRTIGRALRQFRETQQKLTNVVQTEVVDPMAAAANAPKKGSKPAAAADDDADIESPSGAAAEPRRKETFAERRARLAAEKAQREGSAEDAPAEPSTDGAVAAEAPEADGAGAPAVEAVSVESAPADEEPAEPEITTEDLYARRPRRHRAAKAAGDAPAEPASDDAAGDVSEPAADSEEGGER